MVVTSTALAAYIDLGEISVTASRAETAIKDSPVTIEIIDREELETVKFTDSVTELLNRIPGNSLTRNLRIPMGGKNYTINLIDGMAARSFGRGTNGFIDEVNTFDIERVEVIKGPASSLYGSNALGGVINVITRKPPEVPEYRVWGEAGNHKRGRGGVSAAGKVNDSLGYFFDTNYLDYEGPQDRSALSRKTVSGKLVYDFDADTTFSVRGEYLETTQETPGSLDQGEFDADWQQAGIDDAFTDQQIATAAFSFVTDLSERSGLDVKYTIRRHKEQGMPSFSTRSPYGEDDMLNQNMVATYNRNFDFLDSRLIVGVDLLHSDIEEVSTTGRDASSAVDLDESWDILAKGVSPFLQYEFTPFDRARITIGARRDKIGYSAENHSGSREYDITFTNVSPKAGITFDLNENNSLWFSYSEGFVVPSRSYLFTSDDPVANPDLMPEEANNIEFGVRGRLFDEMLKYDVALYDTKIKNMVVTNTSGPTDVYENAGEVEVKGLESSFSIQPADFIRFDAAYTYAKNKYLEYVSGTNDYSGNYLSSSPLHHLNARATWMPRHDLDVELEWDHISDYYTNSDNSADDDGKYQRPDLFNIRVTYDTGSWSVWGHVLNVADKEYARRVSYSTRGAGSRSYTSGTGRTIYAGVSYNW
jgi:iron complex outermembrane receptor protein